MMRWLVSIASLILVNGANLEVSEQAWGKMGSIESGHCHQLISRLIYNSTQRGYNPSYPIYFRQILGAPFHPIYNDRGGPLVALGEGVF